MSQRKKREHKEEEVHPGKIEIDKAEYDALTQQAKELGELRESLIRKAADFENAKKRLAKEKEEFIKFANERLIRDLLTVIDNLERALQHAEETDPEKTHPIVEGVHLIRKQIYDYLKEHGLVKIEAMGKPFDPTFHEAISQQESEDYPDDTVIKVLQEGYLLHDRLLRPAQVIISKRPEGTEGLGEENKEQA